MDEIELPGPNVRAQVRQPPERGCTPDPNPLVSEAFNREADPLIAKRGERRIDAVFLHLSSKIEQRPLGTALSKRVNDRQDVEILAPDRRRSPPGISVGGGIARAGTVRYRGEHPTRDGR